MCLPHFCVTNRPLQHLHVLCVETLGFCLGNQWWTNACTLPKCACGCMLQPVCTIDKVNLQISLVILWRLELVPFRTIHAQFPELHACCRDVLSSMTVALGTSNSKFSAAVNSEKDICVSGTVKGGTPYLTAVGSFDVDLAVEVRMHTCISVYKALFLWTQLCAQSLLDLIIQTYAHVWSGRA